MAKRFTDTDKWKKPMIRSMKASYKLLWLYILDECDHAGVWHVDLEVAQIRIGEKFRLYDAIKVLGDKIHVFDNGEKWFIPAFIDFQYGELNEKNRAHESVLKILTKYKLLEIYNKPLISPLQGAKDKDMDKDKEMDKAKEEGGVGETKDTEWQKWVDLWFTFFQNKTEAKPVFDGAQSSALKKIRSHLIKISLDKNPDKPPDEPALKMWEIILQKWDKQEAWLSKQFNLNTIYSRLNEIINTLRNGSKNGKQPTGGEVSNLDIATTIAKYYSQPGKS